MREKYLGGQMNEDLVEIFCDQVDAMNMKKKKALESAVKLWVSLPEEVQNAIYYRQRANLVFLEDIMHLFIGVDEADLARKFCDAYRIHQKYQLEQNIKRQEALDELTDRIFSEAKSASHDASESNQISKKKQKKSPRNSTNK